MSPQSGPTRSDNSVGDLKARYGSADVASPDVDAHLRAYRRGTTTIYASTTDRAAVCWPRDVPMDR